jgi:excinuclease ABC subunit A
MAQSLIRIVNARQHNLKGITVELPRRALVVITGPSGSGKSSLAFDTLYAEGQRRYIESLSTYAQQFLERMPKPLVDRLEGIAPAVAIEQRTPAVSSRSTVGTATEVHDALRLLWARIGRSFCRVCGAPVRRDTAQSAAEAIIAAGSGRVQVGFPLPPRARGDHQVVVDNLRALGFVRLLVEGVDHHLDQLPADLSLATADEVIVIVDRLASSPEAAGRLAEAVALAFAEGDGIALAVTDGGRQRFSESPACSVCDTPALSPTPALFSFNNPRGACGGCNGFGAVLEYAESLIVPDPK